MAGTFPKISLLTHLKRGYSRRILVSAMLQAELVVLTSTIARKRAHGSFDTESILKRSELRQIMWGSLPAEPDAESSSTDSPPA